MQYFATIGWKVEGAIGVTVGASGLVVGASWRSVGAIGASWLAVGAMGAAVIADTNAATINAAAARRAFFTALPLPLLLERWVQWVQMVQ
jgi:hypothetical protein